MVGQHCQPLVLLLFVPQPRKLTGIEFAVHVPPACISQGAVQASHPPRRHFEREKTSGLFKRLECVEIAVRSSVEVMISAKRIHLETKLASKLPQRRHQMVKHLALIAATVC